MSVRAYDKGDGLRVTASFSDLAEAPADPTAVKIKVKKPDNTVVEQTWGVDAQPVRDGVGAFHADILLDQAGDWVCRWEGTGAVQAAEEFVFIVRASAFV